MAGTHAFDPAPYIRCIVDHVPSMLAYWDRDLLCRFANRAYETWFGVEPESLLGTSIRDLLGPELFALNEPYIRRVLNGAPQTFERTVPGPAGEQRHSLAVYIPDIRDGEVAGFMVQVTDVSRLKKTEAALRNEAARRLRAHELLQKSESALREAQRLGQIGSWEWELDTDTLTWSEEMYRIFENDPSRPPPPFTERWKKYTEQSWSRLAKAVDLIRANGKPQELELEYRRSDGTTGWIIGRIEAVRGENGRITKLHGTAQEITSRRTAREARLQLDLAEAASRNKTLFLSRVSHELRTPLNAVLGFAQLIELGTSPEKHVEWAAHIRRSGQHMLDVVDELLDLSSAELGHIGMHLALVDITQTVRECLSGLAAFADGMQVTLADRLPAQEQFPVLGDAKRIEQVFNNLLSNAIKYNRAGGSVTVSAHSLGEFIEVKVEDTGLGMSADQLSRLFMPFERLGAENSRIPGTGLGLALAKKLVELMGGSLRVESRAGAGSVFTVRLASCRSPEASPAGNSLR